MAATPAPTRHTSAAITVGDVDDVRPIDATVGEDVTERLTHHHRHRHERAGREQHGSADREVTGVEDADGVGERPAHDHLHGSAHDRDGGCDREEHRQRDAGALATRAVEPLDHRVGGHERTEPSDHRRQPPPEVAGGGPLGRGCACHVAIFHPPRRQRQGGPLRRAARLVGAVDQLTVRRRRSPWPVRPWTAVCPNRRASCR